MRPMVTMCAIALLAAGCSTPSAPERPAQISYLVPAAMPQIARRTMVSYPPDIAHRAVQEAVAAVPLTVTKSDPEAGLVVATYSGNPEPYVTCGWIVIMPPGATSEPRHYPAAAPSTEMPGDWVRFDGILDRGLRLDSRTVARVAPSASGNEAVVDVDTTYVLTRTLTTREPDGQIRGWKRETVRLPDDGGATFAKGTTCYATGQLEAAVLQRLRTTSGTLAADTASNGGSRDLSSADSTVTSGGIW